LGQLNRSVLTGAPVSGWAPTRTRARVRDRSARGCPWLAGGQLGSGIDAVSQVRLGLVQLLDRPGYQRNEHLSAEQGGLAGGDLLGEVLGGLQRRCQQGIGYPPGARVQFEGAHQAPGSAPQQPPRLDRAGRAEREADPVDPGTPGENSQPARGNARWPPGQGRHATVSSVGELQVPPALPGGGRQVDRPGLQPVSVMQPTVDGWRRRGRGERTAQRRAHGGGGAQPGGEGRRDHVIWRVQDDADVA
jgi:hypothetical protein